MTRSSKSAGPGQPGPPSPGRPGWWLVLPLVIMLMLFSLARTGSGPALTQQVSYTEFKQLVREGKIHAVLMRGESIKAWQQGPDVDTPSGAATRQYRTRLPVTGDETLLPLLEHHGVDVEVETAEGESTGARVLAYLLPWLLIIGVYLWVMRKFSRNLVGGIGRGGELGKFLKPRVKEQTKPPDVTFDDVAGQENAKREVAELVEYLDDPERYRKLGAEVPRGILLMGAPGTGKTLLARALAGEAKVPFFSISASEFIEVFVGVGASRVRDLFNQAKAKAPSILFIDELDSVGRVRGTGLGGGHDEREQTLNQILAEMDGFSGHEAVIVLAATNRPDVLDPALLRPGRFDRHVVLDLPDKAARLAILRLHTAHVPLHKDADLEPVAAGTPGFSGADLKNLVNEAAMRAARERRDKVRMEDFDQMRERVLMGTERTLAILPKERHRLAVHEAGHTLVAHCLPEADPLYKVSIIPRGQALGATQQLPEQERHTLPEEYLRARLTVLLAGRTAERIVLGSVSSGADDDIRQATSLARSMVARWGMSPQIGPVDLRESEAHPFLGREVAQPRQHSEASARAVDEAVRDMLKEIEAQTEAIIGKHRAALDRLVDALEQHETLDREQIVRCIEDAGTDGHPLSAVGTS